MEVNLKCANAALTALYHYKAGNIEPWYGDGEFKQFKLKQCDITDLMTCLLHLIEQLKNEGEEGMDPEEIYNLAWLHFEAEVLDPDGTEIGRRQLEKEEKAHGRRSPAAIFRKSARIAREQEER